MRSGLAALARRRAAQRGRAGRGDVGLSRLGSKPAPKASAESPKAAPPACACEPTR